jgi:hypothetical protein
VSGALVHEHLRLRTDLSYGVYIYAFPVQQLLVICGLGMINPILFAIIATITTLPLAALSWFLVEKPAMSLKRRLKRKAPPGREACARVGDPPNAEPWEPAAAIEHAIAPPKPYASPAIRMASGAAVSAAAGGATCGSEIRWSRRSNQIFPHASDRECNQLEIPARRPRGLHRVRDPTPGAPDGR